MANAGPRCCDQESGGDKLWARLLSSSPGVALRASLAALLGALLAGCFDLLAIGTAPWLPSVTLVAVIGTLWACASASPSPTSVLLFGYVFGATFLLVLTRWLIASIGWQAWLALGLAQGLWFAGLTLGWRALARRRTAWLWAGLLWGTVELLRGVWPLGGMPWGRVGFALVDGPWQPVLAVAGVAGLGSLVGVVSCAVGEAGARVLAGRSGSPHTWSRCPRGGTAAIIVAVLTPVLIPGAETSATPEDEEQWRAVLVQPGVPGDGTDVVGNHREITRSAVTLTAQALLSGSVEAVDVVVWPESATAVDPLLDEVARGQLATAAAVVDRAGGSLLAGGIVAGPDARSSYNKSLLYTGDGRVAAEYSKEHPVPFGEYLPWRPVIEDWSGRFALIPRDVLPGADQGPMEIDGVLVANAICFDIAYDDVVPGQVREGAQVVVVRTSNATFFGTSQLEQQLQITRARAVESGRPVVVAAVNGLTAVIGHDGQVISEIAAGDPAVLVSDVELRTEMTPAVRLQGLIRALVVLGGAAALLVAASGSYARSRRRLRRGHPLAVQCFD